MHRGRGGRGYDGRGGGWRCWREEVALPNLRDVLEERHAAVGEYFGLVQHQQHARSCHNLVLEI